MSVIYRAKIAFAMLLIAPAAIAQQPEPHPTLRAGTATSKIELDGRLEEADWQRAPAIENITMVEPKEGAQPSFPTIVKVLANPQSITFGVRCEDPQPDRIVSFSKARDSILKRQDHIRIVLDTFQDGRSGYIFDVNPSGARYDALIISNGEDENSNWDGIWESATNKDAHGWSVEIRIAAQTLAFEKGLSTWNFNVERRIQRFQETDRWAGASQDYLVTFMSHAGILADLPRFDLGLGLSIRPSFSGGAGVPAPDANTQYDHHPSLDVTKRAGSNLLTSLTVNTDFAETEFDARQVNLTRFPLFFPEKRTFFLEGADIFDFGLGLGEDIIPFFSRRIGLIDRQEVPLRFGTKINGRIGQTNLGALYVHTGEEQDIADAADMGVVRIKQNVFAESSVGLIATSGDPRGISSSWLTGADFTYQSSHFLKDKNLLMGIWGLVTDRSDLEGDKKSYGAEIAYPNDLWDSFLAYRRIGDAFDPSLGFVPRTGVQFYNARLAYQPRPGWSLVRQMFHEFETQYVTDLKNRWESYEVFTAPINWRLETGDRFEFNFIWQGERLDEPFEISKGVAIPMGSYQWRMYRFELQSAEKRKLQGIITWLFGDFYDGTLNRIEYDSFWNPSGLLTFEFVGEHDNGHPREGDFTTDLVGTRARLNFSPNVNLSSFLQYDTESKSFGTNTRLRWTILPVCELFVIYNHNLVEIENHWMKQSNELLVKIQYTIRK
jgi:Domain of unknown function (DUF5916)